MQRRGSHFGGVMVAALLWSTSFAFTKVLLGHVGAVSMGAFRFVLAAAFLALICLVTRTRLTASFSTHLWMGFAGLVGITGYFMLENFGVEYATASDAVLIVAATPIFTMIVEWLVYKRTPRPLTVLGALIALGGLGLVTLEAPDVPAKNRPVGIALLVTGMALWAVYNIISARAAKANNAERPLTVLAVTTLQNVWGGLGFVALLPFFGEASRFEPTSASWGGLVYLAIGCSALAYLTYTYGLSGLRASQAVAILNLIPVFGIVFAVVLAHEPLTLIKVVGTVIIVLGIWLNARDPEVKKHAEEAQDDPALPSQQYSA